MNARVETTKRRCPVLLLVEGNATLRGALRRRLSRRLPVTLIEAGNVGEAVALTREHEPDVILLDLSLPGQSGGEIIPLLRSIRPGVRLIAMVSQLECQHDEAAARGTWTCISKEMLGSELEPLLWQVLPSAGLRWPDRWTRRRVMVQSSRLGAVQRGLAHAFVSVRDRVHWLNLHGPWAGQPRIRVLYVANLIGLGLVFVQHSGML